jgi:hypothetical protein
VRYKAHGTAIRDPMPTQDLNYKIDNDLSNTDVFLKNMTKLAYYVHFLRFSKHEIATKGIPATVNKYVFKGDKRAVKCKLLEIKGWSDLITYGVCKTPVLYPERIFNCTPKIPEH